MAERFVSRLPAVSVCLLLGAAHDMHGPQHDVLANIPGTTAIVVSAGMRAAGCISRYVVITLLIIQMLATGPEPSQGNWLSVDA